ncbi:unnamed protein product [Nezara viridula]|uniref:Uncharacterized protein n=1 Tax=Nezara viridula TaxID=85310 RepID=A0A9P0GYG7_NEZVI|nr:unnamed protein product [Nezara viridula]
MLFSYLLLLVPEDCHHMANNNCIHFTYRLGKICYHKIITIFPSG